MILRLETIRSFSVSFVRRVLRPTWCNTFHAGWAGYRLMFNTYFNRLGGAQLALSTDWVGACITKNDPHITNTNICSYYGCLGGISFRIEHKF